MKKLLDSLPVHVLKVSYPEGKQNDIWHYFFNTNTFKLQATQVNHDGKISIIMNETTETQRASRSGSGDYIPCVGTIWEDDFTSEAVINWVMRRPTDFQNFSERWFEVSYPVGRGKCDLVLCGSGFKPEFGLAAYEWAIENKYVRFIGDNGKNNDYGVTKVVSPYRKDRSSVLDAERQASTGILSIIEVASSDGKCWKPDSSTLMLAL